MADGALANAERLRTVRRRLLGPLPFPRLKSDVRDVVYTTWLVPIDRVRGVVPMGVNLIIRDGMTPMTVLTYRHGHFGPVALGPLRRLLPSPLQSNWRLYVASIHARPVATPTVLFVLNLFDSALYAVGSRLFSDALPSHLPANFSLETIATGWRIAIDGGEGSAPSFDLTVGERKDQPTWVARWFGDVEAAYRFICLQDAAIVAGPDDTLVEARIALPIDVATVEPLMPVEGDPGSFLRSLGADHSPWCFRVASVPFTVLGERLLVQDT